MKHNKNKLFISTIFLGLLLSSCSFLSFFKQTLKDFTEAVFKSESVDYDGNSHILAEVSGAPEGTTITYSGREEHTNAGVYEATALLTKEGYNDKTLTASLTINPLNFSNITFESLEVLYDGAEHEVLCNNVPSFASVKYTNNKATNVGTYNAKAVVSAPNYNDLTLNATLKIKGKTISGVTFNDASFEYDGNSHSLEIEGELPSGVSVSYSNNNRTNVGSQTVTATLSGTGYETLKLTATLTILGKAIAGVSLDSETFIYDGQSHSLAVKGTIPSGVSVSYSNNNRTNVGSQTVTAKLSGANYETLTLTATLSIVSLDSTFGVDPSKTAYELNEELYWDDIFNELLKGNYTLRYYSGSRNSLEESFFLEDLNKPGYNLIASDGVNFLTKYHSEYDETYDEFNVYCVTGEDMVHHEINFNGTGKSYISKLPSVALKETETQLYPAQAFTALSKGENGELLPGYNNDDYYGDDGEYLIHNDHLYIKHEHSRTSDGETTYFYRIYEFYNVGNTKLDISSSLFFNKDQIAELSLTSEDFYIDGVRYGTHLVSTYNSPNEFMAHTYLRNWQKLIVPKGAHFVYPGFYDKPVQRVVFNYYSEQKYIIPNMTGYELNFCFDSDGVYQGEYFSYGTVTDKSSSFVSYGGVTHYYGEW